MKHNSQQEWGQMEARFPKQFQNFSNSMIPNEDIENECLGECSLSKQILAIGESGGGCLENCPDAEVLRCRFQSKCFSLVVELVSSFFDVSVESLQGRTRGAAPICQARQICMYLLHTSLSISYPEIGRLFRRDRTTISHACMVVEDLRDDCAIDQNLTRLESILETIRSLLGGTEVPFLGEIQ